METKKVTTGAEAALRGTTPKLSVYPLLCEWVWGKSHGISVISEIYG